MGHLKDGYFVPGTNDTDEDIIELSVKYVGGGDGAVLVLTSAPNITWWKGICKGQWEMLATQDDRHGPQTGRFPLSDLDGAGVYKAKFLGVHTYMYPLKVAGGFENGYEYHFNWVKD